MLEKYAGKLNRKDDYTGENTITHNLTWLYITDYSHRVLIITGSGSGITNGLLNLLNTPSTRY